MGRNGSATAVRPRIRASATGTIDKLFEQMDGQKVQRVVVSFTDLEGREYCVNLIYDGSPQDKQRIADELQFGGVSDGVVKGWLPTDGSSFPGFDLNTAQSDMIIAPDLDTFRIWQRQELNPDGTIQTENIAHLWADIRNPDGTDYECCPRTILKRAVARAKQAGIKFTAGSEQEFFVSKAHGRLAPIDGEIYYQRVPEWLVRAAVDLRRAGLETDYIHHEVAPGQFEIRVRFKDALSKADDVMLYKRLLREAAALQGLSITFMPKPQDGINGSGMHVHWGMFDGSDNVMYDSKNKTGFSRKGEAAVAALMAHANESAIVHNPAINSYRRLKPGYEAPVVVCWGPRNRTAMFRQPAERTRIENRVLDGVGSPHLKFTVMIHAALRGVENPGEYSLGERVTYNVFHPEAGAAPRSLDAVPQNFGKAIEAAGDSELLREALGARAYNRFMALRQREWKEYRSAVGRKGEPAKLEWECQRYWDR